MHKALGLLVVGVTLLTAAVTGTGRVSAADNLVPNPSVENTVNGSPIDWHQGYLWGDLDATYEYVTGGHQGTHAVKTSVTRYVSGDAKWYFTPQPITPGTTYTFSDYYIATVPTAVIAMVTMTDSSVTYLPIGTAPIANTWSLFNTQITMPAGAQLLSVFHVLDRIGSLTTDTFSLTEYTNTTGFNRGLVSVTFDDGWQSIYDTALPLLEQHAIKSTQYITTGFLNTPEYMTDAHVLNFLTAGHQIASHTVNHLDLTVLGRKKLINELSNSRAYLEGLTGTHISALAAPYGAYNQTTIYYAQRYYHSQRTSDVGFNTKTNFDRYRLRSHHITPQTTLAEFQSWVSTANTEKTWLILMYHNVDTSGSAYSVTPQMLSAQLAAINASGLVSKTVDQALAELEPQL